MGNYLVLSKIYLIFILFFFLKLFYIIFFNFDSLKLFVYFLDIKKLSILKSFEK